MAKKFRFTSKSMFFIVSAVGVVALLGGTVLSSWFIIKSSQEQKQRAAAVSSGKSFVSELKETDTVDERIGKLSEAFTRLQGKIEQLEQGGKAAPEQFDKRLDAMNNALNKIELNVRAMSKASGVYDARIKRLEAIVDKAVKSGGMAGAPVGSNAAAQQGDGATVLATGVAVYGERKDVSPPATPEPARAAPAKPQFDYYIPSGSHVRIRMKNYVLAPAGGLKAITGSDSAAYPFFVEILDDIELPDGSVVPTGNEGVALLMAVGDATNERVLPRLKTMRFFDGTNYYELGAVSVSIMDSIDRAPGLMGRLDTSKRGTEIAKAAGLQAAKVFTDTVSAMGGATNIALPQINPATGQASYKIDLKGAGWAAAGGSLDRFIQFYLDNAAQYFDVIQVSDKIAVKRPDGRIEQVPHEAEMWFNEPVFVKKVEGA